MVREFQDTNEWAVILGASSGLGLATAHKLAAHGMNLCLVYRNRRSDMHAIESNYQKIIDDHNVDLIHYNLDAIKSDNRMHIISELKSHLSSKGKVKVLVHSIAKGNLKPMISTNEPELQNDDFRLTIESMAISLYDWTKEIFNQGIFSEDTRIISFTSEGNTKAWSNYAAVSAAKVAIESISRSIALEFADHGIKANCIQAGITDTASLQMIPGSETLIDHATKRNPSGRLTTPEDVANVVYLLTKDEAKWITGTIIPVNGGEHLR
jgi:enoyl-[acyl-carrier protein] reductase I